MEKTAEVLSTDNLSIGYQNSRSLQEAVCNVTLSVRPGEFAAVVGESGSGKTTLIRGILGLLRSNAVVTSGTVRLMGERLLPEQMHARLGRQIGFVPQNPMTALNPLRSIGSQMQEVFLLQEGMSRKESRSHCLNLLNRVQLGDADRVMASYPHQLSGGMAQRVALGMSLARGPSLFVADEPTSSVDAPLRNGLMEMVRKLCMEGMAVLFVTHDLKLVGRYADSIVVMKNGCIVEFGKSTEVIHNPSHDYTRMLLHDRCCR